MEKYQMWSVSTHLLDLTGSIQTDIVLNILVARQRRVKSVKYAWPLHVYQNKAG